MKLAGAYARPRAQWSVVTAPWNTDLWGRDRARVDLSREGEERLELVELLLIQHPFEERIGDTSDRWAGRDPHRLQDVVPVHGQIALGEGVGALDLLLDPQPQLLELPEARHPGAAPDVVHPPQEEE